MTDVSIIIPVYNGEKWIDECLRAVRDQDFSGSLEISIFNDGSTDETLNKLEEWKDILKEKSFSVIIGGHSSNPRGVGYAKNRAVEQSNGVYLCFQDIDDVMSPDRVSKQYQATKSEPKNIVGSKFHREPAGSTERFTHWANNLTNIQLYSQIYTSHGPTLIMPTWFCHRAVFDKVGGFNEDGKGVPEDLIFFLQHLELGGGLLRVDADLLMYRYHPEATTFSIHEDSIWRIRMEYVQKQVIEKWETFTIWNAGKQGRKFYRSLTTANQRKVATFCDVDPKKISCGVYTYHESKTDIKPTVPIVHFQSAKPPFIICIKLGLTGGEFEKNLESLNLKEGVDFFHFN
ncbi:UDP-GlcNAc:betaGal beta-1,3-N-acetylglucosaminyltransferase-like protein 1 [Saccostrea echinata]|uniref:UDP-GlcNAc:betaGal beta-1,3-N-acetylglucosaminyltransferase-like protein 1 n=1 Tax=Saccostrea echinata TaxID=191078 RepID=UPI002A802220|nr:UDP-GlcNAc:betaGal beta-1,3-N-acetylglucosaminyltransferase-like protein 1 [Saccostrea echinata]